MSALDLEGSYNLDVNQWYQWDWRLVGLMDDHIASSRALAAILDPCELPNPVRRPR